MYIYIYIFFFYFISLFICKTNKIYVYIKSFKIKFLVLFISVSFPLSSLRVFFNLSLPLVVYICVYFRLEFNTRFCGRDRIMYRF